jgi:hypothetical protein
MPKSRLRPSGVLAFMLMASGFALAAPESPSASKTHLQANLNPPPNQHAPETPAMTSLPNATRSSRSWSRTSGSLGTLRSMARSQESSSGKST